MGHAARKMAIRLARSDDASTLAELSTQLGYPSAAEAIGQRLARIRAEGEGEVFVAVDAGERVIGWAHVVTRLLLEEHAFAELAGLVVADGVRGLGVGAQLLRTAETWASEQGLAKLRVRSNVLRERAHGFYRREGYTENKRQLVFEKALR